MDRKAFIKKGILGTGMFVASGVTASVIKNDIDELKALDPIPQSTIGFNHLPTTASKSWKI
ncbi:MAG: hypothetical protein IPP49_15100 [Saprospiraceae bacterium]|nr:hypothetical protein [Saprospiraceae bacterium]